MDSDDVILRAPEPADVDFMYLLENDPKQWNDGVTFAPLSRKQLWDYVETYDGNIFASGQLRMIIELDNTKTVVGIIDLYDYDRINRRAYVGISVLSSYRNKGIGGLALEKLIVYSRDTLGMNQLAAVVRADNCPSLDLFKNYGFIETGRFKSWIRRGNEWVDAIHWQLIF